MTEHLSIGFRKFFYFFSRAFVRGDRTAVHNPLTQRACYDIYYDTPSSLCHM